MKRYHYLCLAGTLLVACTGEKVEENREPVNFSQVEINDNFWKPRLDTHATVTLDVCIDQCEHATSRVKNFAVAAGVIPGAFDGLVYDDSDLYKMIEGVAYSLINRKNPALEAKMDTIIDYIAAAQCEDGYLMTYYILGDLDQRWQDMDKHEMYCCGHLIEAAIAYHDATGKKKLLDVAIRFANHLLDTFGPEKRSWVPGHQEIELALVKLYYKTSDARYLDFAEWLLEQRGHGLGTWSSPDYHQDIVPVRDQRKISGHAVRAMYMFTAMADVMKTGKGEGYQTALDSLWSSVVERNMYITGGIGSSRHNEGFTRDYDLPNREAYCETCASVGMVLWNNRMNLMSGDGKYADVMERSLYNGVLAGISLTGDRFFYVNPLESDGNHHRRPWYRTACCPSQLSRFLPSVGNYIYAVSDRDIWVNLYIGNSAVMELGKHKVAVKQITNYPWEGRVEMEIVEPAPFTSAIYFRIPDWCENYTITCNGRSQPVVPSQGYATLSRKWKAGDRVVLDMQMEPCLVASHPKVEGNIGKRALQYGPLVYCIEEEDNPDMDQLRLIGDMVFTTGYKADLLNGVVAITGNTDKGLVSFIPYHVWDNRDPGKMKVWIDFEEN